LWQDSLIDASIFREWVLNVGRRDARARVAHMLCEFALRSERAGLGAPAHLDIPLTQGDVAEATGLSAVHVNRVVQRLREEGALEKNTSHIRIKDWERLIAISAFDASYLHAA
jgi:CRP-like cAMP-binding protein